MAHGGKRRGAGRKRGSPNKVTAEARAVVQAEVIAAIKQLVQLAHSAENEAVQLRSLDKILQYGVGKPGLMQEPPPAVTRVQRDYRWAYNPEEAILDPARSRFDKADKQK
jgi:hypothetical protein